MLNQRLNNKELFHSFLKEIPKNKSSSDKERLLLLPLNQKLLNEYLEDLWEYSSIKDFYKYLEYPAFSSFDECKNYFYNILSGIKNETEMLWLIIHKKDKKAIGTIRLHYWDLYRKKTQIGYGISPNYGKKGYFSEALLTIINYTFEKLKFYRIEAWTRWDNIGSIKGLEKIGFLYEGKLREYQLAYDNERYDIVIYSILKRDLL